MTGPARECVVEDVDLTRLPILTHFAEDGGAYVTAGVLLTRDPELGPNMAFHRLMRVGPRAFTARLVEGAARIAPGKRAPGTSP